MTSPLDGSAGDAVIRDGGWIARGALAESSEVTGGRDGSEGTVPPPEPTGGTRTQVLALVPASSAEHRRVLVREWFRERFWALPSLLLVVGAVLAVATTWADTVGLPPSPGQRVVTVATADTFLGIIATAMLTFVGVVFTITLVALQLASAQLSPRVLRTFVRSPLTKVTFGVFLATFAFSMTVLALDQFRASGSGVARGVTVATLLVAASLLIFVAYVTATMRLLQVSWVLTAVATETRRSVAVNFPPAEAYVPAAAPALTPVPALIRLPAQGPRSLGVLLGIDRARLVGLARRHGCALELVPRIGAYVDTGSTVFAVHGGTSPPVDEVVACVDLGRARSVYQDPSFGLRQLVDVATQALSPALNQATTATQVVDRLEDVLLRILRRPPLTGCFVDADDVVRLLVHEPSWDELLDLAFTEISVDGASSPQVARRLMAAYDALADAAPPHLQTSVQRHRSTLADLVRSTAVGSVHDLSLSPHRLGMG
jgi:uncharacterized membrane protein